MKEKVLIYRKKHPKCKFCKYHKYITKEVGMDIYSYDKCILKEKIINLPSIIRLCKYYEPKEIKNER